MYFSAELPKFLEISDLDEELYCPLKLPTSLSIKGKKYAQCSAGFHLSSGFSVMSSSVNHSLLRIGKAL